MHFGHDRPLRTVKIPFEKPSHDLPIEHIPLFKLELNSIPIGSTSPEASEGPTARQPPMPGASMSGPVEPDRVVLPPPVLNHDLGLLQRKEPFSYQHVTSQLSNEALVIPFLPRTLRLDEPSFHPNTLQPRPRQLLTVPSRCSTTFGVSCLSLSSAWLAASSFLSATLAVLFSRHLRDLGTEGRWYNAVYYINGSKSGPPYIM